MCQGYQTIKQNPFLVKREAYSQSTKDVGAAHSPRV